MPLIKNFRDAILTRGFIIDVLLTRVSSANVKVASEVIAAINYGLITFVGFNKQDSFASVDVTVEKILNLRVFQDAAGKTNLSLRDTDFELLVIPNFTLSASTKKGRRPSFDQVLSPAKARVLYQYCLKQFKAKTSNKVAGGIFGADMKINNSLDGPLNFVLKSI